MTLGFQPNVLITVSNSSAPIEPPPSLSKKEKISLNSLSLSGLSCSMACKKLQGRKYSRLTGHLFAQQVLVKIVIILRHFIPLSAGGGPCTAAPSGLLELWLVLFPFFIKYLRARHPCLVQSMLMLILYDCKDLGQLVHGKLPDVLTTVTNLTFRNKLVT